MCKAYTYVSLCKHQPGCPGILGRKTRNRWCREALDARRLGRCGAGVERQPDIEVRENTMCFDCKTQSRRSKSRTAATTATAPTTTAKTNEEEEGRGEESKATSVATTTSSVQRRPVVGGGGRSSSRVRANLFDSVFTLPLEEEVKKSRSRTWTERGGEGTAGDGYDDQEEDREVLVVVEPEDEADGPEGAGDYADYDVDDEDDEQGEEGEGVKNDDDDNNEDYGRQGHQDERQRSVNSLPSAFPLAGPSGIRGVDDPYGIQKSYEESRAKRRRTG
ncbi:hypothetical protein F4778DRAFT_22196 [Xylariomycetidae sp. FL2044]|nr:hypothetical protein F4778DRAFT_22196 [Xylariomycetidae sp. FL2044]